MFRFFSKREDEGESDNSGIPLKRGDIVLSTKGRDRGTIYVVVDILPPRFCLVSDGRKRAVAEPKKKSHRHLKLVGQIDSHNLTDWGTKDSLINREIRKALEDFVRTETEEGGLQ
jgi:hypothetical protein